VPPFYLHCLFKIIFQPILWFYNCLTQGDLDIFQVFSSAFRHYPKKCLDLALIITQILPTLVLSYTSFHLPLGLKYNPQLAWTYLSENNKSTECGTCQQHKAHTQAPHSQSSSTYSYNTGNVIPEGQQIQYYCLLFFTKSSKSICLVTEFPFKVIACPSHYYLLRYDHLIIYDPYKWSTGFEYIN
jgi:hypothetical protein